MDSIFEYANLLNGNKFFWGITMLFLNFGSRFIIGDLGKVHEQFLGNEIVKKVITFSLFFVATRDVIIAFILTILYVLLIDGILHEQRQFCILPEKYKNSININDQEYKKALEIVQQYEKKKGENPRTNVFELYKEAVISL